MQENLDKTIGLKCEEALTKCEEHRKRSAAALTDSIKALDKALIEKQQKTLFDTSALTPSPPSENTTPKRPKSDSCNTTPSEKTPPLFDLIKQTPNDLGRATVRGTRALIEGRENLLASKTELRQSADEFRRIEKEWKRSIKVFKQTEIEWNKSIIATKKNKTERNKKKLLEKTNAMTNCVSVMRHATDTLAKSEAALLHCIDSFENRIHGVQQDVENLEKQQDEQQYKITFFESVFITTKRVKMHLTKSKSDLEKSRREVRKARNELDKSRAELLNIKRQLKEAGNLGGKGVL